MDREPSGIDLAGGVAAYPMVEESEATGTVAGVYARLLTRMPFVPSLFKSLAVHPGYLVLAAEQAGPVLDDDRFEALARDLADSVRSAVPAPEDDEVRTALAEFDAPLRRMLLMAAGLRVALQGELDVPPAPGRAPEDRPVRPERPAPSLAEAPDEGLYDLIQVALQTPIVNTVWRALADRGLLGRAWSALGPLARQTRPAADELARRSLQAAQRVPWQVAATPAALRQAGLPDARAGMAAVLDAYVLTLSRVLVLVASSTGPGARRG